MVDMGLVKLPLTTTPPMGGIYPLRVVWHSAPLLIVFCHRGTTMRMKWTYITGLFPILWFTVLAGCSDGGADSSSSTPAPPPPPPPTTSAEGLWNGTTSTGRTIGGLVLDDGSSWFLYSVVGNPTVVAGMVQGNGTSDQGSFTSSNAKDFSVEGPGIRDATITGSYVQKNNLTGTITYQGGETTNFAGAYNAAYELSPDMNSLVGTYSAPLADNQIVTVTLSTAGTLSGNSTDGCTFTGTVSPRTKGNVFNVTVTFQGGACSNGTDTVSGVAFFDAATQRLHSAGLNSTRTNGFIFIATKI